MTMNSVLFILIALFALNTANATPSTVVTLTSNTNTPSVHLLDLPSDFLIETSHYFSLEEAVLLRGVNTGLLRFIQNEFFSTLTSLSIPSTWVTRLSDSRENKETTPVLEVPDFMQNLRRTRVTHFPEFKSSLENLERLDLLSDLMDAPLKTDTSLTNEGFLRLIHEHAADLPLLKALRLSGSHLQDESFRGLLLLPSLIELFTQQVNPARFLPILAEDGEENENKEEKNPSSSHLRDRLEILHLHSRTASHLNIDLYEKEAKALASFTRLREFALGGSNVAPSQLQALQSKLTLQVLLLPGTSLSNELLQALSEFTGLTDLLLGPEEKNHPLTDEGMKSLNSLQHLTHLTLNRASSLTPRAFEEFYVQGSQLLTLNLGSTLSDEMLAAITQRFPNLQSLIIAPSYPSTLTSEGFAYLNRLKRLRELVIIGEGSSLNSQAFNAYNARQNLRTLHLGHEITVDSAMLQNIVTHSPNLEALTFYANQWQLAGRPGPIISDDDASRIATGLPNLQKLRIRGDQNPYASELSTGTHLTSQGLNSLLDLTKLPFLTHLSLDSFHFSEVPENQIPKERRKRMKDLKLRKIDPYKRIMLD